MALFNSTCALLADRHAVLSERVRDLLEADFKTVYVVGDALSLQEGAQHLAPAVIVLDLSLAGRESASLLKQISELSPSSKVIALSVHDDPLVVRTVLTAGAWGVVLKRSIGTDLHPAISAVLRGEQYVSSGFEMSGSGA
jgi:DNA-binding NarL/FixJ family response regulator